MHSRQQLNRHTNICKALEIEDADLPCVRKGTQLLSFTCCHSTLDRYFRSGPAIHPCPTSAFLPSAVAIATLAGLVAELADQSSVTPAMRRSIACRTTGDGKTVVGPRRVSSRPRLAIAMPRT